MLASADFTFELMRIELNCATHGLFLIFLLNFCTLPCFPMSRFCQCLIMPLFHQLSQKSLYDENCLQYIWKTTGWCLRTFNFFEVCGFCSSFNARNLSCNEPIPFHFFVINYFHLCFYYSDSLSHTLKHFLVFLTHLSILSICFVWCLLLLR